MLPQDNYAQWNAEDVPFFQAREVDELRRWQNYFREAEQSTRINLQPSGVDDRRRNQLKCFSPFFRTMQEASNNRYLPW